MHYEVVDIRKEIAEYERLHRPFPPRSGSVSKPYPKWHGHWAHGTMFWSLEDKAKLAEEAEMEEMSHYRIVLILEEGERIYGRSTTRRRKT